MESLPYIDEHRTHIGASPERTWAAVVRLARGRLAHPAPAAFASLWRLEPASGFAVAEETAPRHLVYCGNQKGPFAPEETETASPGDLKSL